VALGVNALAIKNQQYAHGIDGAILTPCCLEQSSQIQRVRWRVNNFEI
jgi:hypothetical protein